MHVINAVKEKVQKCLLKSNVHLVMDRYKDSSMKSGTRALRAENMANRPHKLRPNILVLKREHVLKCTKNQTQLNELIANAI